MEDVFCTKIIDYQKELYRYALKLTKNQDDAHDLVQDTFLKAISNKEKYRNETNIKAWLFTILKNTFINIFRHKKRENNFIDITPDLFYLNQKSTEGPHNPESLYNEKELLLFINQLDEKVKIPFQMFMDGYKYEEIAEQLEIKLGTIKSRIFFARRNLIDWIKHDKLKILTNNIEIMKKETSKEVQEIIVSFRQVCNNLLQNIAWNKSRIVEETGLFWTTLNTLLDANLNSLPSLRQSTLNKMKEFMVKHSHLLEIDKPIDKKVDLIEDKTFIKNKFEKADKESEDSFWSLLAKAIDCGVPENVIIKITINKESINGKKKSK